MLEIDDLGVILQLVEATVSDDIAWVDAFHLGFTCVGDSRLYVAHVCDIVLNHVDKRSLAILLNGRCRNQRHALQRIHQQTRVYELVREKRIILIVELRSPFHRAGRRINLVVERDQLAGGDFRLRRAIKGVDSELGVLAQAGHDRAEAVFRDR